MLRGAIARLTAAMERDFDALNTRRRRAGRRRPGRDDDAGDARDLRAVRRACPTIWGRRLLACAQAFTKTSGSSYGTLMATGLMAMAKVLQGPDRGRGRLRSPALVAAARDAMQARGKAELGGKTVLDSLDAVARATAGLTDPRRRRAAAVAAAHRAMDDFRDRPATIGRARIFAEKSDRHGRSGHDWP